MKKTLTALAVATSMMFLGAGAASAEEYPAPPVDDTADVAISDTTVVVGEAFVFSGTGFASNEEIVITVSNEDASAAGATGAAMTGGGVGTAVTGLIVPSERMTLNTTADAEGDFAVEVDLGETGTYTLTAIGQESGITQSASVEVVAAGAGTGDAGDDAGAVTGDDTSATAGSGDLASTGLSSSAFMWAGAGLLALALGFAAVVVARRKNA